MNRLISVLRDARMQLRSWRVKRQVEAEALTDLNGTLSALRAEVRELREEIDELRGDSRRVAELRILVEDELLRRK